MVGAAKRRFEIAQDRIDPTQTRLLDAFAAASGHDGIVRQAGPAHTGERRQPITDDMGTRCQCLLGPRVHDASPEAGDHIQAEITRAPLMQGNRCDKRHFIPPLRLAWTTGAFAAQIGIIDLDLSVEPA